MYAQPLVARERLCSLNRRKFPQRGWFHWPPFGLLGPIRTFFFGVTVRNRRPRAADEFNPIRLQTGKRTCRNQPAGNSHSMCSPILLRAYPSRTPRRRHRRCIVAGCVARRQHASACLLLSPRPPRASPRRLGPCYWDRLLVTNPLLSSGQSSVVQLTPAEEQVQVLGWPLRH